MLCEYDKVSSSYLLDVYGAVTLSAVDYTNLKLRGKTLFQSLGQRPDVRAGSKDIYFAASPCSIVLLRAPCILPYIPFIFLDTPCSPYIFCAPPCSLCAPLCSSWATSCSSWPFCPLSISATGSGQLVLDTNRSRTATRKAVCDHYGARWKEEEQWRLALNSCWDLGLTRMIDRMITTS